jgi:HK97 gp10 family phage protein
VQARMVKGGRRKAVVAGARVIANAMIERTPTQLHRSNGSTALEVGELKEHIKVRASTDDNGDPIAIAGPDGQVQHVAHWVEYGHRMVTGGRSRVLPDGRTQGGGKAAEEDVPAHPFLRPAFESSANAALEAVGAELKTQFEGR